MKKNKMMRLASGLLVMTLLTTCIISGTFAKYVTTAEGSDTARVAKWGVEVTADSELFETAYASDTKEYTEGNTVEAVTVNGTQEDVIAPGTEGSMTFSITGKPEVAVKVAVTFNENDALKMVKLPGGNGVEYTDYTVSPASAFKQDTDYYPVKWTLKRSDSSVDDWSDVDAIDDLSDVNLQKIQEYFNAEGTGLSKDYAPNTELDKKFGYYQLSWKWEYESGNDKADTYLGNVAAGLVTSVPAGVSTVEAFDLSIAVTQID